MKPPNITPPPNDQTQTPSQQQPLPTSPPVTAANEVVTAAPAVTSPIPTQPIITKPQQQTIVTTQQVQQPLALAGQLQTQTRPLTALPVAQAQSLAPPSIAPHSTAAITLPQSMPTQIQSKIQSQPQQQPAQPQLQTTATIAAQPGQPMTMGPTQVRPHTEYVFLLANPRQPGIQGAIRYPFQTMNLNQPNILQNNQALLRSINASQLIRAQTSTPGVMQPQTSQVQTTTMANIQGRHIQIPFGAAGPRGQLQMMTPRATILQQPTLLRGVGQPGIGVHPVTIPTSQQLGVAGLQATIGQPSIIQHGNLMSSTATAPSHMTADDALTKGTSFFNTLLTKVQSKSKKATLQMIQALIDGKKTSEEFALALQKELNSHPQPQLVPFLDLALPNLRQSLTSGVTKLPGIRPPPTMQDAPQTQSQPQQPPPPDDPTPSTSSPNKVQSNSTAAKKKKTPLPPGQKSAYAIKKEAREAKKKEKESLAAQGIKVEKTEDKKEIEKPEKPTKPKPDKPKSREKQKKQEKQLESLSSALRDDDDVNDVAAMGGVNLAEESQRIMASGAELVGTQIRSCKDEPFLDTKALSSRIARIAKEYNLSEPSKEVVTMISHATQERLKNMVERLGILAEHRSENLKFNPKYDVSTDIKGQMKFLAELDRIEKRRYEEQERELLLRVAKSRSKVEDPEQQKLRQKAKDMQRAEQEEVRQREANETALLAIGPRKKPKTSTPSSVSSFSQSNSLGRDTKTSIDIRGDTMRRVKRVNIRDLQVLLELDRSHLNRLIKMTAQ